MNLVSGILLAIVGAGIIGFWLVHIRKGGMPQGIRTLESGSYLAFHITAESLTGALCLIGGIAYALNTNWGYPVTILAAGMLLYTSINSLAWKEVKNKPQVSIMFIVPAVIAVVTIVYLILAWHSGV